MKDEQNIDRLFQESFKDFEVNAPTDAWSNIEKKIAQKKKRRIVPFWFRLAGAAAILAILLLAGSQLFISPNANNSIVDAPNDETVEKPNTQNNSENSNFINLEIQNNNLNTVVTSEGTETNSTRELGDLEQLNARRSGYAKIDDTEENNQANNNISTLSVNNPDSGVTEPKENYENAADYSSLISALNPKELIQSTKVNLTANLMSTQENKISLQKQKSLVEVAEQINMDKLTTKEKKENSWFVKPQISPVFYGNLGSGSAIDQNFDQSSGQGEVNVSFGVNVAYQVSKKIKVRTGINRVNLNYNTSNVFVLPTSGFSNYENINLASGFESSVINQSQLSELESSQSSIRLPSDESQLQQQLGFIEIPMELEYKLVDKTIDVNIIGGASSLLLNNNSLDVQTGSNTTFLGEANNVNNVSFSTNFAIGLDYDISEKLILNLEPTFKYQFNTFQSGTTDFQPFFVGVYSGVVFKF